MGQIVVNVGSFDLTSHNGNTAYSSVRHFNIPSNAGITGCVATFATHVNTGNFQGKSFSLNGAQAHPNTPWPTSGIALNPALLATGQNTFRAAVKSQAGLSARWAIGDIYLTITYNDVGGGGGGYDIGSLSVNKTSMTAGESLTVSVGAASSGVYRDISISLLPSLAGLAYVAQGHGSGAGSWAVTIPESWCEAYSPNDPSFEVRIYVDAYIAGGTPVGNTAKMVAVNVPASAVPTIGAFTATRDANGVDASITNYVQNYSKVSLAMGSVAGALGSSIQSYEITGGGWNANADIATFGPFPQAGDITFIAKVTDTRGRTATKSVTIGIMPYTPVSGSGLSAFRSDVSGDPADEGTYAALKGKRVFSSLNSQNTAVIKGRVFEKGTTPPDWTSMFDDTPLLIGALSIEKGYTVQIAIADKITSVIYIIEIPTSIVGLHILPGATGAGIGMYGVANRLSARWPIYVGDDRVALQKECPHRIGDVIFSIVSNSPAATWPATAWTALPTGKFIRVGTGGNMGGNDTHVHSTAAMTLTIAQIPLHQHGMSVLGWDTATGTKLRAQANGASQAISEKTDGVGGGGSHGHGNTGSSSNVPAYYEVYAWRRTA